MRSPLRLERIHRRRFRSGLRMERLKRSHYRSRKKSNVKNKPDYRKKPLSLYALKCIKCEKWQMFRILGKPGYVQCHQCGWVFKLVPYGKKELWWGARAGE